MKDVISNVKIYGLEDSIRASKYPMSTDVSKCTEEVTNTVKKLFSSPKGEGHDNALVGIVVQFDLSFTVKAWTEAERYHFFDIISSQSSVHKIAKFDLNNAYIDYVDPRMIDIMKEKVAVYNNLVLQRESGDKSDALLGKIKEQYLKILYSNPCGFILTARITTNYRQLKTMYNQRRPHPLPEWQLFCDWVETLPYFEEFIKN